MSIGGVKVLEKKRVRIHEDLKRINMGVFRVQRWVVDRLKKEYPRKGGRFLEDLILKETGWKYTPNLSDERINVLKSEHKND